MSALLQAVGQIVGHTPFWVFGVFALLVFLGIQALRERTLPVRRIVITPAVFITWGIIGLATAPHFSSLLVGDWVVAAAAGASIAAMIARFARLRADRDRQLVHLPGSTLPLIRNLVIFTAKYGLAVAMAITPAARDHLAFWSVAVSGLSAGYFLGWLGRLVAAYRRAPALAPAFAVQGGVS